MEMPAEVLIHSELMGLKGNRGTLLSVSREGYYEVNLKFGDKIHRVMLPVARTVLIQAEPEPPPAEGVDIERYGEA